jgi:hypothetical protein
MVVYRSMNDNCKCVTSHTWCDSDDYGGSFYMWIATCTQVTETIALALQFWFIIENELAVVAILMKFSYLTSMFSRHHQ